MVFRIVSSNSEMSPAASRVIFVMCSISSSGKGVNGRSGDEGDNNGRFGGGIARDGGDNGG